MNLTTLAASCVAAAPQALSHSRAGSPPALSASFIVQRRTQPAGSQWHCQRRAACAPPAAVPAAAAAAAAAAAVGLTPAAAAAALAAQPVLDLAAAMDEAPVWTLDQAVGLVFGGLLVLLYLSSTQVDRYVARQQRRELGLCEECGGLNQPGSCAEKNCPLRRQA